jgi:hypothetical protein
LCVQGQKGTRRPICSGQIVLILLFPCFLLPLLLLPFLLLLFVLHLLLLLQCREPYSCAFKVRKGHDVLFIAGLRRPDLRWSDALPLRSTS